MQRGFIYPLIAVILVISSLVVSFFLFSKTETPPQDKQSTYLLEEKPTPFEFKKNQKTPCKKEVEENEGSCALGTIIVRTHRNMTKDNLTKILNKHNLSLKYDSDYGTEETRISFYDRENFLTNQEWEQKLADPKVKEVKVSNTIGDNSKYILIYFTDGISDKDIDEYISTNQLSNFITYDLTYSLGKDFYVQVPEGTEYDWERLKEESTDIIQVSLYIPQYSVADI